MIVSRLQRVGAASVGALPPLGGGAVGEADLLRARLADSVWGFAGVAYFAGGRCAGWLLLSPPPAAPAELAFEPDAAVLTALRVAPSESLRRVSKELVRGACARLLRAPRPVAAVEAAPAAGCPDVSGGLLAELGFVATDRPGIVRLELSATVRWWRGLSELPGRLGELVQPAPPVEPARRSELRV
ncbi:hypothetical protein GGQ54_001603 [Naumannella cuiyingiana]|uniref:N-acetyltransferase domain-containing protein n=1 Tax=Naumannella cuiyingiana TaxID=1347891 RepID=A0A7Z0IKZ6_9ACTN|nr:hypothetical protein [Naumannella cuiyingiana]NYI71043.1 hypothetical protein [Naumannella cuiyingiana]